MNSIKNNSLFVTAIIHWLAKFSAQGLVATDDELNICFYNDWFEKQCGKSEKHLIDCNLLEAFTELSERGFDRYYRNALRGQGRVLSHRFHKYLLRMPPPITSPEIAQMQQSARISPLFDGEKVIGTITVIEDVTERVAREMQLNSQIEERESLLSSERIARQLAEENSRLKDSNESLRLATTELLESKQARGKLLHQIISAQEEERKRISRNIHDHLGQQLTALRLILSSLKELSNPSSQLDKAYAIAEKIDSEVDFLAWELRPTVLDDLGLVKALEDFVNEWSRHLKIPVEFHTTGLKGKRLSPEIEINLYRIVQEALNNVSKHAKANQVGVLLEEQGKSVVLIIEDDGIGFEMGEKERLNVNNKGMGLFGIKERVLLVGGTIEIESAIENGTTIYVRVPTELNDERENKLCLV
ncbi:MAG TPA: ATP-binding protein [Pyrinomonadaceae bacterium]